MTIRHRIRSIFVAGAVLLLAGACFANNADCIKPWKDNPHYWQYKGKPVLLIGGSETDHIFLWEELKAHLDEVASVGANYVRCTMSQREGLDLKPHRRLADGKFDLNQWNEDYWNRFANCLKWCRERDIVMQIEVWDRFDFAQDNWQASPWRPQHNITYTNAETLLAEKYPAQAWMDRQPFFHTIPGMPRYKKQYDIVRGYQEKFVDKMLSYSLDYPNVLYCMDNETSTNPRWGRYWMKFIQDRAAEKKVEVYTTDMFDDAWKPQSSGKLRQAFDDPKNYPFIDVSQVNSRTFNEGHWTNISWIVSQMQEHARPLNNTKIYSDGQTKWGSGTPVDGLERFWRNLIAGCASCRFHRPGGGIGLNDLAKSCIKAARIVERSVKFWEVEPHMELLGERDKDEAYLAAKPGEKYILYFTDGGSVTLDLNNAKGRFDLQWVNIRAGRAGDQQSLKGGSKVTISAPGKGGWAAAIVKKRS